MKSLRHHPGESQVHNSPRLRPKPIGSRETQPSLTVGALCLNFRTCNLRVGDRVVLLTPSEFELLHYLMSRVGQVLPAEQLLCQVWQYPPGTGRSELIRAHIKNLRIKIERNSREPEYLRTIGRRGYVICEVDPSKT